MDSCDQDTESRFGNPGGEFPPPSRLDPPDRRVATCKRIVHFVNSTHQRNNGMMEYLKRRFESQGFAWCEIEPCHSLIKYVLGNGLKV